MKLLRYIAVPTVFLLGGCTTAPRQAEAVALFNTPPRVEFREAEVSVALVVGHWGRRYVLVEIRGERLLFVIDTGAPNSLVATTVAREDRIATIQVARGAINGVGGGVTSASAGIIEELRVGTVAISRLPVFFTDLAFEDGQMSAAECKKIVGLMGSDLLEFLRASIDYSTNTLTIRRPNH